MNGKMESLPQLKGTLTTEKQLKGNISKIGGLKGEVNSMGQIDIYEGPYEIIPSTKESITLETKQKVCNSDITFSKIPYSETPNSSNGNTVYIGKELMVNG